MKRSAVRLIPALAILLALHACGGGQRDDPAGDQTAIDQTGAASDPPSAPSATLPAPDSVITYEYIYPYNGTLVENHYIELSMRGSAVSGRYYGTTDDFDTTREGYLPGFFATTMNDLRISGDAISFILAPHDIFITPRVPGTDPDAATDETRWKGPTIAPTRSYRGVITPDRITLETASGLREFKRVTEGGDKAADSTSVSERTAGEAGGSPLAAGRSMPLAAEKKQLAAFR